LVKTKQISSLRISEQSSLLVALKQMDAVSRRLLIVDSESFNNITLISIGDIQRYLIRNQNLDSPIRNALRDNIIMATESDNEDNIRKSMITHRIEFMPVLDHDGSIMKIIIWEDLVDEEAIIQKSGLSCPVVIMAGGQGTRLRPITHIIPKPLIPIGEKPIMQIIVDHFRNAGCKDYFFSVGYKAKMIKAFFDDIVDKDYNITYYKEDKPMGTAGSLSLIKDKINSTFFISNCDVIIEQDYNEIYKYHTSNGNELTAVAFVKDMKIPYGTFEVEENGILQSLVEKPEFTFLVNAGMYILEPHLLNEIPDDDFFHITHLMENIIARKGKVGVFPISEGSWLDIGQWKEYQKTLKKYGHEIDF